MKNHPKQPSVSRTVRPRNPLLDVLTEPITPAADGKAGLSATDVMLLRQLRKAFEGDPPSLASCLKRAARREIKLMGEQAYAEHVVHDPLNLNYEWAGDVAALLGIAGPRDAPEGEEPHENNLSQRYELREWVIDVARERGSCSDQALANIRRWQEHHCPQWRRVHEGDTEFTRG